MKSLKVRLLKLMDSTKQFASYFTVLLAGHLFPNVIQQEGNQNCLNILITLS